MAGEEAAMAAAAAAAEVAAGMAGGQSTWKAYKPEAAVQHESHIPCACLGGLQTFCIGYTEEDLHWDL